MPTADPTLIQFSINNWSHLYSLEQAINRALDATGQNLTIQGTLRKQNFLDNQDTDIYINFYQVDDIPSYSRGPEGQLILGEITRLPNRLDCKLPVDGDVFEEMRKNLMEYADIEGIHIMVTLGLLLNQPIWPINNSAPIIKLDYAMRGDA